MEMFGFRIVHVNGVDIFDTSRCTPYSSLTPAQMQEYIEADVQLNYMEIQKRKEQREISEGSTNIKQFIRKLFGE